MRNNPKRIDAAIEQTLNDMSALPVGSEERLSACKELNQQVEARQKASFDWTKLIPGVSMLVGSVIYMVYNDTHLGQALASNLRFGRDFTKL